MKVLVGLGVAVTVQLIFCRGKIGVNNNEIQNFIAQYSHSALKPGLHFERKSTANTQTILRTCGAFSRPQMPIYAVGIAQVPSVNTPTIRRLLRVDVGLSLANSLRPLRIRRLLCGI